MASSDPYDPLDVGLQRTRDPADWVPPETTCIRCFRPATRGAWCAWCHPSNAEPLDDR
jgi:hypothetical protein